jgi:hypothetical protein
VRTAIASAWADRGAGIGNIMKLTFCRCPRKAHPISNVLEFSRVHLIYHHEHIIFAAQHDTTLLQCSCKLMQQKKKSHWSSFQRNPAPMLTNTTVGTHPPLPRPVQNPTNHHLHLACAKPEQPPTYLPRKVLAQTGNPWLLLHRTARSSKDV